MPRSQGADREKNAHFKGDYCRIDGTGRGETDGEEISFVEMGTSLEIRKYK